MRKQETKGGQEHYVLVAGRPEPIMFPSYQLLTTYQVGTYICSYSCVACKQTHNTHATAALLFVNTDVV